MAVYFILAPSVSKIKIGVAAKVVKRFDNLRSMSPVPLLLLGHIEGSYPVETKFHRMFSEYRIHGEWFDYSGKLKEYCERFIASQINTGTEMRFFTNKEVADFLRPIVDELKIKHKSLISYSFEQDLKKITGLSWRMIRNYFNRAKVDPDRYVRSNSKIKQYILK